MNPHQHNEQHPPHDKPWPPPLGVPRPVHLVPPHPTLRTLWSPLAPLLINGVLLVFWCIDIPRGAHIHIEVLDMACFGIWLLGFLVTLPLLIEDFRTNARRLSLSCAFICAAVCIALFSALLVVSVALMGCVIGVRGWIEAV